MDLPCVTSVDKMCAPICLQGVVDGSVLHEMSDEERDSRIKSGDFEERTTCYPGNLRCMWDQAVQNRQELD